MPSKREVFDFEPLTPTAQGRMRRHDDDAPDDSLSPTRTRPHADDHTSVGTSGETFSQPSAKTLDGTFNATFGATTTGASTTSDGFESARGGVSESDLHGDASIASIAGIATHDDAESAAREGARRVPRLRRGHGLTYFWLFLFTVFLYVRPYEFIPFLEPLSQFAFPLGVITLAIFIPSQLTLEGTLTARPREVNLALLLCLCGLLSIPLAVSPGEALETFGSVFIKAVVMFVVLVNVVRTEKRLKQLIVVAAIAGCILSLGALRDYLAGNFTVEGYRVKGNLRGWMDNPNDMAIHFVMMIPVVAALCLSTRNLLKKLLYAAGTLLMLAGTVVTFSRGAFLGLACAAATFGFKLARRNRFAVAVLMFCALVAFVALAPANYSDRLLSIVDHSRDPNNSAGMRQAVLAHSVLVALRHPLLGVGMGNFHIFSEHELVTHNAYTQVASEMGLAALVVYVLFIVTPLRRLGRAEREMFADDRRNSRFYYLSVGLQASLVGYAVSSFFGAVAYLWFVYYFVGFAVALRRMYESEVGREMTTAKAKNDRGATTATGDDQASDDQTSDGQRSDERARDFSLPETEARTLTHV